MNPMLKMNQNESKTTVEEFLETNRLSPVPVISQHAKERFLQRFHGVASRNKSMRKNVMKWVLPAELIGVDGETQEWINRERSLKFITNIGTKRGVRRLFVVTCYHVAEIKTIQPHETQRKTENE